MGASVRMPAANASFVMCGAPAAVWCSATMCWSRARCGSWLESRIPAPTRARTHTAATHYELLAARQQRRASCHWALSCCSVMSRNSGRAVRVAGITLTTSCLIRELSPRSRAPPWASTQTSLVPCYGQSSSSQIELKLKRTCESSWVVRRQQPRWCASMPAAPYIQSA